MKSCGERGFTLIEVLVALAILMIALSPLFGSMASALRIGHTTGAWDNAVTRAQSRLAAIEDPGRLPPVQRGDDGGTYAWETRVLLLGTAPPASASRSGPWANGTALYGIDIVISWRDGDAEQHYRLSSARLGTVARGKP